MLIKAKAARLANKLSGAVVTPVMSGPQVSTSGLFAVNKPLGITSAAVIRTLQKSLLKSPTFEESLQSTRQARAAAGYNEKAKRKAMMVDLKMGHGGTLDPMATGVLILGLDNGTKQLGNFLECTKDYEAVAIFGCSTDTYDSHKCKIMERTPYSHVTAEKIEEAMKDFRGDIQQRPPIYSALHINGMRLYEYARKGIPVPIEIKKRNVHIAKLELTKFVPGGEHEYGYPKEEMPAVEKKAAQLVADLPDQPGGIVKDMIHLESGLIDNQDQEDTASGSKRKLSDDDLEDLSRKEKVRRKKSKRAERKATRGMDDTQPDEPYDKDKVEDYSEPSSYDFHESTKPPIMHIKMSVSGGTYVRSIIHDLAQAIGSSAHMVKLVRTRQAEYELGKNVVEWEDLMSDDYQKWEPAVLQALEDSRTVQKSEKELRPEDVEDL